MWSTVRQSARVAVRMKWRLLTLKYRLIALGIALLILLLIIIVAGILDTLTGIENEQATETPIAYSDASLQVSDDVLQYREAISRELKKEQLEGQTNVVLALMMQESGGRGNDPMQASESKCGRIGCITSPDESIRYGVKHFASVFRQANKDVKLTLQSYNFGGWLHRLRQRKWRTLYETTRDFFFTDDVPTRQEERHLSVSSSERDRASSLLR